MRGRRRRRKNRKLRLLFVLILLFIVACLFFAEKQFAPVILSMAKQQAQSYAVRNLQSAAQAQIAANEEAFNYQSLMHIEKDAEGRIILMTPDTMRINMLVSSIVLDAEQSFHEIAGDAISVPLGLATGSKLFASMGPDIDIDIRPIGEIQVKILDDFEEAGINQTRHRIWLELGSELSLAVPFDSEKISVSTSVLLAEGIIVGPIPQTYISLGDELGNRIATNE